MEPLDKEMKELIEFISHELGRLPHGEKLEFARECRIGKSTVSRLIKRDVNPNHQPEAGAFLRIIKKFIGRYPIKILHGKILTEPCPCTMDENIQKIQGGIRGLTEGDINLILKFIDLLKHFKKIEPILWGVFVATLTGYHEHLLNHLSKIEIPIKELTYQPDDQQTIN